MAYDSWISVSRRRRDSRSSRGNFSITSVLAAGAAGTCALGGGLGAAPPGGGVGKVPSIWLISSSTGAAPQDEERALDVCSTPRYTKIAVPSNRLGYAAAAASARASAPMPS